MKNILLKLGIGMTLIHCFSPCNASMNLNDEASQREVSQSRNRIEIEESNLLSKNETKRENKISYSVETLTVHDSTADKKFSIVYEIELSDQRKRPIFTPFYNNMRLNLVNEGPITFANSLEINIEPTTKNFIRMEEWNGKVRDYYYIDPSTLHSQSYPVFLFEPDEEYFIESNVKEILSKLQKKFPDVSFDMGCYNRHGIGLFGTKKIKGADTSNYTFYWLNPKEKNSFKKVDCQKIDRFRDGGSSFAFSEDCSISFDYKWDTGLFLLNNETAFSIENEFLKALSN